MAPDTKAPGKSPPGAVRPVHRTFKETASGFVGGQKDAGLGAGDAGREADAAERGIEGLQALGALHSTNGRWDIVAELRADSLSSFDQVLGRIRQLEGISSTETSLLLSTFKL